MSKNFLETFKGTMNIGNLKAGTVILWNMVKDHEAEAWMAVDIAAGVGAVATAIVATTKAVKAVEEKKAKKEEPEAELSKKEVAETVWKYYIPTTALTALSVGGAIGSNKAHEKQYAALAALLTISETQNKDLLKKIDELFGEGSKEKVKEAMFEDKLNAGSENGEFNRANKKETTVYISSGSKVHFEDTFGNEWDATIPYVESAIRELNTRVRNEQFFCCSVNEFVMMAGGNPEIDKFCMNGDTCGWSASAMAFDEPFEETPIPIKLTPFINQITKEMCVYVEYQFDPIQYYMEY